MICGAYPLYARSPSPSQRPAPTTIASRSPFPLGLCSCSTSLSKRGIKAASRGRFYSYLGAAFVVGLCDSEGEVQFVEYYLAERGRTGAKTCGNGDREAIVVGAGLCDSEGERSYTGYAPHIIQNVSANVFSHKKKKKKKACKKKKP